LRRLATGLATLVVAAFTLLAVASASATVVNAPGFASGPQITPAGLAWEGAHGPMLTRAASATRPLHGLSGGTLTSPTSDWVVVVGRSARVKAARIGAKPRRVALPHRCSPLTSEAGSALLALSGSTLYAVVNPDCARARSAGTRPGGSGRRALAAIDLATGRARLLGAVAADVIGVAAAGARVAVTYLEQSPATNMASDATLGVAVLDAAHGRRLYAMHISSGLYGSRFTTEVDRQGDVLVTSTIFIPPGSRSWGWWATPAHQLAHPLVSVDPMGSPISTRPRSIADGPL
jgi:hypothetical protein